MNLYISRFMDIYIHFLASRILYSRVEKYKNKNYYGNFKKPDYKNDFQYNINNTTSFKLY